MSSYDADQLEPLQRMKRDISIHQQGAKPKGKGKQCKHFLEKSDAISLAAAIGDEQESKAQTKADKYHRPEIEKPKESDRKPISNTKAKLKATKAVLSAARVKAKRERSKQRKERFKNAKNRAQDSIPQETPSQGATGIAARVRKVSFA